MMLNGVSPHDIFVSVDNSSDTFVEIGFAMPLWVILATRSAPQPAPRPYIDGTEPQSAQDRSSAALAGLKLTVRVLNFILNLVLHVLIVGSLQTGTLSSSQVTY